MKTKKILSLVLVVMMIFTTALTGCTSETTPGTTTPGTTTPGTTTPPSGDVTGKDAKQELIIQTRDNVTTMDPNLSSTVPDWKGSVPVYEGLTRTVTLEDGTIDILPGVAESWTISEDGLVYTFSLRKDAKWSDGQPVTAKDFEYTWQRIFDPKVATPYAWMVQSLIKNADAVFNGEKELSELGVKAVDDYTFEMTLVRPSGNMLTFVGFPTYCPVRKDLIEKYTVDNTSTYGSAIDKIVGNGPFIMTLWEPNGKMVYEPNPNYWNKDEVYLTKLTRQVIIEPNAIAQSLIANEVDIAGLNEVDWNDLVESTGLYDTKVMSDVNVEFFMFNCEDPILKNEKIRLAISLAYNREQYCKDIEEGKSVPDYSMVAPSTSVGTLDYKEAVNGENEYIKTLASQNDPKALLLEGMKELGLGDDPSKVEISYTTRGTSEYSKKSAEWIKQNIESVLGIKFNIKMTEWNIMYELVNAKDYQITQGGWSADYNDPANFLDLFHNKTGYYNEAKLGWTGEKADQYAALIDKTLIETDDLQRAKIYAEAEKILLEDAPVSPHYTKTIRTVKGKYVKGYYTNPYVYMDYVGVYMQGK